MAQRRCDREALVHRLAHVPSDYPVSQAALLGDDGVNQQFGNTLSQDTLSQDTLPQDTLPQDTV